ncbi:HPr kinase/phosphorylase [Yoonia sp. R2-816]|uniref:HPr kinase/phosphorylase n=1 Tax=Yoonia sp. R2-816 TaxID=3342638 RepID=UPI003728CA08
MTQSQTIHATCVAWNDRAVLIRGGSGSGKSTLGLVLMGMGCSLVADDRVIVMRNDDRLLARAPDTIRGLIEARGIGVLNADPTAQAQVVLVVDLDETESERLPPRRVVTLLGSDVPLIHAVDGPHFAPAILQLLKAGWSDR